MASTNRLNEKDEEGLNLSLETAEPPAESNRQMKRVVVDMNLDIYADLEKIMRWYKCDVNTHTVRMMIVDIAKGLENGDVGSRFK